MHMLKNPTVKTILSALAVPLFGFILLNAAFLLDFLFQSLLRRIFALFTQPALNPELEIAWFPPLLHILFLLLILTLSWLVFRSNLPVLVKAIFMTVPLATLFVTLGIFFYQWPVVPFLLGGALAGALLVYFQRTCQPWLYSYTVMLVALVLAIFTLSGGEI